jgi:hypothetical protein
MIHGLHTGHPSPRTSRTDFHKNELKGFERNLFFENEIDLSRFATIVSLQKSPPTLVEQKLLSLILHSFSDCHCSRHEWQAMQKRD